MAKGGQPQTPVAPADDFSDECVGIPVPSGPRGGVFGAAANAALASGLEEDVLLDTPAPADGYRGDALAANVPCPPGRGLHPPAPSVPAPSARAEAPSVPPLPPSVPPLPPSLPSSRDPLVIQSARMLALERENTELKEQLARANLQASSAALAAQDALAEKSAHMFALQRENKALEREITEVRRHLECSGMRAAALEADIAQLQGRCVRYKKVASGRLTAPPMFPAACVAFRL